MTTTKSETPSQEKKGDRIKRVSEKTEEELKPSMKKDQNHHHHQPLSRPPSTPTLQDSFNNSHSHHSFSEGDLQMVVASHSHDSISDGAIKVVKEEVNNNTSVAVMDVENGEEEARDGAFKKVKKWYIVLLILKIAAFVFCKIAFSVMASDRKKKLHKATSKRWNELPSSWYGYYGESPPSSSWSEEDSQSHWNDFQEFK